MACIAAPSYSDSAWAGQRWEVQCHIPSTCVQLHACGLCCSASDWWGFTYSPASFPVTSAGVVIFTLISFKVHYFLRIYLTGDGIKRSRESEFTSAQVVLSFKECSSNLEKCAEGVPLRQSEHCCRLSVMPASPLVLVCFKSSLMPFNLLVWDSEIPSGYKGDGTFLDKNQEHLLVSIEVCCVVLPSNSWRPLVWLMLYHLLTWWYCNEKGVYWWISDNIKTLLLHPFSSFSSTYADVFLFFCFKFCQGCSSVFAVSLKFILCFKLILARTEEWVVDCVELKCWRLCLSNFLLVRVLSLISVRKNVM